MANGGTRGDGGAQQELLDAEQSEKDFFYHGTIIRLSPKKKFGIVRTSSGKDLPFSFELVELLGPVTSPRGLREGLVVGYDMSWTSRGLKVTKIKTYRKAADARSAPHDPETAADKPVEDSEREQGESKHLK